jgi:vancomycin resistance protein YoaR
MDGRKLDVSQSAHRISASVATGKAPHVLRAVVHKTPPAVSTAELKGIRGVLSRFTTHFNAGNKKRAHNLRLAASRLDGKLLWPGKTLSLNEIVRERTQKNGFLTATVIEEGKRVPGIGGGSSQVAGTLFNAALLGGLKVEQYQTHARPIPYLPVGRDATLSEQIDLKVNNPTKTPIYISAKPSGSRLTVTIFGAPVAGRKYVLAVNKKKLAPTHVVAELYRLVKKNGRLVAKERIGRSEYQWVDEKAAKARVANAR